MEINGGKDLLEVDFALPGIDDSTVVLITGGYGAIGFRCAEIFLGLGANVAIMSRSKDAVEEATKRLGSPDRVLGVAGDVARLADAERAVASVVDRFGRLDVLVNCAAVSGNTSLEDIDEERIDKILAINVKGTLLMAKAAAVPMRAQGRGRIINVSSIMGHRAAPKSFLYGSSKAAVGHATRSLAVELGPFGITVNCLSPASTPTSLRDVEDAPGTPTPPAAPVSSGQTKIPLQRRGVLDDYVGPILFFASDLSVYVTGTDVLSDGGLSLLRP
jgi:NAD(P)-dependent dehydrogenase (short-subunit alcohol dehydrogenase family)